MIELILVVMENKIFTYKRDNHELITVTYNGLPAYNWGTKSMTVDFNTYSEYLKNEFSIVEFYGFKITVYSKNVGVIAKELTNVFGKANVIYENVLDEMGTVITSVSRNNSCVLDYGINFDGSNFIKDMNNKKIIKTEYNLLGYYIDANSFINVLNAR